MWWGYGFHAFAPLLTLGTLFLIFAIVRLFAFRRWGRGCGCGWGYRGGYGGPGPGTGADAEAVLQRRLAAGEIDEAEYRRVREILRS